MWNVIVQPTFESAACRRRLKLRDMVEIENVVVANVRIGELLSNFNGLVVRQVRWRQYCIIFEVHEASYTIYLTGLAAWKPDRDTQLDLGRVIKKTIAGLLLKELFEEAKELAERYGIDLDIFDSLIEPRHPSASCGGISRRNFFAKSYVSNSEILKNRRMSYVVMFGIGSGKTASCGAHALGVEDDKNRKSFPIGDGSKQTLSNGIVHSDGFSTLVARKIVDSSFMCLGASRGTIVMITWPSFYQYCPFSIQTVRASSLFAPFDRTSIVCSDGVPSYPRQTEIRNRMPINVCAVARSWTSEAIAESNMKSFLWSHVSSVGQSSCVARVPGDVVVAPRTPNKKNLLEPRRGRGEHLVLPNGMLHIRASEKGQEWYVLNGRALHRLFTTRSSSFGAGEAYQLEILFATDSFLFATSIAKGRLAYALNTLLFWMNWGPFPNLDRRFSSELRQRKRHSCIDTIGSAPRVPSIFLGFDNIDKKGDTNDRYRKAH